MAGQIRGAKRLTARDWLFGSRPRRLVIRFILDNNPPDEGWTKTDIAVGCGLSVYGGATAHIEGLAALGLLKQRDGRYWGVSRDSTLFAAVADLVDKLEAVPEVSIDELRLD